MDRQRAGTADGAGQREVYRIQRQGAIIGEGVHGVTLCRASASDHAAACASSSALVACHHDACRTCARWRALRLSAATARAGVGHRVVACCGVAGCTCTAYTRATHATRGVLRWRVGATAAAASVELDFAGNFRGLAQTTGAAAAKAIVGHRGVASRAAGTAAACTRAIGIAVGHATTEALTVDARGLRYQSSVVTATAAGGPVLT